MSSRLRNLTAVARYWGDGEMKVYAAPIEDGRGGGDWGDGKIKVCYAN